MNMVFGGKVTLQYSHSAERIWLIFPLCSADVWCRWHRKGEDSRCQVVSFQNGCVHISIPTHACGTCYFPLKRWSLFLFLHLGNAFWVPWIKEKVMLCDFQGQVIQGDTASTRLFLGIHSPMVVPASGQYSPSDSWVSDSSDFTEKLSLPLPTQITNLWAKYCHCLKLLFRGGLSYSYWNTYQMS